MCRMDVLKDICIIVDNNNLKFKFSENHFYRTVNLIFRICSLFQKTKRMNILSALILSRFTKKMKSIILSNSTIKIIVLLSIIIKHSIAKLVQWINLK